MVVVVVIDLTQPSSISSISLTVSPSPVTVDLTPRQLSIPLPSHFYSPFTLPLSGCGFFFFFFFFFKGGVGGCWFVLVVVVSVVAAVVVVPLLLLLMMMIMGRS